MREITSHKVNGCNEAITIEVLDPPGPGGGNHIYKVTAPAASAETMICFQNGSVSENGVNGLTNEALLAIVEDRLQCFQAGQYACRENAIALTKVQEAMHWLHHRTRDRIARGVEGTNVK